MSRIKDKIADIQQYIKELKSIIPNSFDKYENDLIKIAACERYIEKIIESATDIVYLFIKKYRLNVPETDAEAYIELAKKKLISKETSEKLKKIKGLRNFIIHQYDRVDNKIVFDSLQELDKDIILFLEEIKEK